MVIFLDSYVKLPEGIIPLIVVDWVNLAVFLSVHHFVLTSSQENLNFQYGTFLKWSMGIPGSQNGDTVPYFWQYFVGIFPYIGLT